MDKSKYVKQMKHIKATYSRFQFDLKPELLQAFKDKCKENGTTPTTELKRFISAYCEE